MASLDGARLVTASETTESSRLNEARIKALTGGDSITARFLFKEFFTFSPQAKFWLAVNHLPVVKDDSDGFWRRVRVVPFARKFAGDQVDRQLGAKLRDELPGILGWALQGAIDWQRNGLQPPSAVLRATDAYRESSDNLAEFISDACEVGDDFRVEPKIMFRGYEKWAAGQYIDQKDRYSQPDLLRQLYARYPQRKSNGVRYMSGIRLRTPVEATPPVSERDDRDEAGGN